MQDSDEISDDDDVDGTDPIKVVEKIFSKYSRGHFLKFEEIDEPLHPSATLCALLKVASMMKDPSKFDVQANHDRLYLPTLRELKALPTEDEVLYLTRCGVFWDSDYDCFGMHC